MFGIFLGAAVLYLYCICPNLRGGRRKRMRVFARQPIAHRGLFDNAGQAPENSLAAFRRAAEAGYGVELDVRLTAEGEVVVMHDDSCLRAAGVDRRVREMTAAELGRCRLFASDEAPPLFSAVLREVAGRVPVVVEVKAEYSCRELCEKMAAILDEYAGPFCVESFSPFALLWFRRFRPKVLRGQLSSRFPRGEPRPRWYERAAVSLCLLNVFARPDFIAYDWRFPRAVSFLLCRRLFHVPAAGWTIRSGEEMERAKRVFGIVIFEGFRPGKE